MNRLGKKQSIRNDQWIHAAEQIETLVSRNEIDTATEKAINDIKTRTKGLKAAYAYSGGKDSIVLSDICTKAGITDSVCGICELEYPEFLKWIYDNMPANCTIINTGQNIVWLSKHLDMLFPKDSAKAAKWFSIVQHRAQKKYYTENGLNIILLGRRRADGNYTGTDGIYTNRDGITRYSPLYDWPHEYILAYIHYHQLELPPIYSWKNGYLCGTHPWPARQWTGSDHNGWHEIYEIDKSIVISASEHIPSAKLFLEEVNDI